MFMVLIVMDFLSGTTVSNKFAFRFLPYFCCCRGVNVVLANQTNCGFLQKGKVLKDNTFAEATFLL